MEYNRLVEPGIVGIGTGLLHGAAHYTFGDPSSFGAAAVSEVGVVVVLSAAALTYAYHEFTE